MRWLGNKKVLIWAAAASAAVFLIVLLVSRGGEKAPVLVKPWVNKAVSIQLNSGKRIEGVILRSSGKHVLVRLRYSTVTILRHQIKSIAAAQSEDSTAGPDRLPSWDRCLETIASLDWAKELKQVPATVISSGVLRYVPYISHEAGQFEFNIYGDPDRPACLEVGVYAEEEKPGDREKCLQAMRCLLRLPQDQYVIDSLDPKADARKRDGLIFEITPPDAEDAFGGWWISVYSTEWLDAQRASKVETQNITIAKEKIEEEEKSLRDESEVEWDPPPVAKPSREVPPSPPYEITRWSTTDYSGSRRTRSSASTSGTVYVRGYYRKDGTYVRPHTRRKPRRRR